MTTNDGDFYISIPQALGNPREAECPCLTRDKSKNEKQLKKKAGITRWGGGPMVMNCMGKRGTREQGAARMNHWRPLSPKCRGGGDRGGSMHFFGRDFMEGALSMFSSSSSEEKKSTRELTFSFHFPPPSKRGASSSHHLRP